ncbi:hypothetical protein [Cupriavidus basilensis]|uniref:hypothetical protein n=1 Tax=Cupriavidus basilensis TaxID=68895 RepID=UPI001186E4EF|nr:hypothetical protein [Cupriavidus basilensis]
MTYSIPGSMPSESLAKLFQESQGQPVIFNDASVVPIHRHPLAAGKWHVRIERISAKKIPVQGLRIKVDRGHIAVAGQKQKDIVLWEDTSPDVVDMEILCASDTVLKAWNVWRIDGIIMAWVGNSGMIVENEIDRIKLLCSDGTSSPEFNNLIVTISIK